MKTLHYLLGEIGIQDPNSPDDLPIHAICQHSRSCIPNSIFVAMKGLKTDGSRYIAEAIQKGAVCILVDHPVSKNAYGNTKVYVVEKPHSVFARLCSALYGYPADSLVMIGVSGTDGKSTSCDYIHQLLGMQGIKAGLLTTVSMDDGSGKEDSPFRQSTPEADQIQDFLSRCKENGTTHVVLECTSHALSSQFDRLHGITFDVAIVTKVTSEHLEFHKSLEEYTQAKANLVRALKEGGWFISSVENTRLMTFLDAVKPGRNALVLGRDVPYRIDAQGYHGTTVEVLDLRIETPLLLPSLATNALLAAYAVSLLLGLKPESTLKQLGRLLPVKGRMQLVDNPFGLRIIIDFAHTADAYEGIFCFAKRTSEGGDIIAVFGCAGERDTSKRAPMGRIANCFSSTIILTEEDPRKEGNRAIFHDLRFHMNNPNCKVMEIEDRKQAIRTAISMGNCGDTILLLGKGHEKTIERANEKIPWDEQAEALLALQEEEKRQACK